MKTKILCDGRRLIIERDPENEIAFLRKALLLASQKNSTSNSSKKQQGVYRKDRTKEAVNV